MFSFFKNKKPITKSGSALLPKSITNNIVNGENVLIHFGKDRACAHDLSNLDVIFLSNKGNKNLNYQEVYREPADLAEFPSKRIAEKWIIQGKLPPRKKKLEV